MPAKTPESLVDRYGKELLGYLNFEEFKKLYSMASEIPFDKI
jgi:hypothetical protein